MRRRSAGASTRLLFLCAVLLALSHVDALRVNYTRSPSPSHSVTDASRSASPSPTDPTDPLTLSEHITLSETDSAASSTATARLTPSRSRLATRSQTAAATASASASFEGASWLCRGLALSATIRIVSPFIGPPVPMDRAVFAFGSALQTGRGLVAHVNITSCHRFFRDVAVRPTFALNNTRGEADLESLLDDNTLLNLGGFVSLADQSPTFVSFTADAPQGGVLRAGPDTLYSPGDGETVVMSFSRDVFVPRAPRELNFILRIDRDPTPPRSAESGAASAIGFTVSATALLTGNSNMALLAGRVSSIRAAMDCPGAEIIAEPHQNILGVGFGSERRLAELSGGNVYNVLLVLAVALGVFVLVGLHALVVSGDVPASMALFHFPTVVAPLVLFVYQGTVFTSVAILAESRSFVSTFFAAFAFLCAVGFLAVVAIVTHPITFSRRALRAGIERPSAPLHPVLRFIFGAGMWVDRGGPFVLPFGGFFTEYLPRRQWFLVVELAVSFIMGIAQASLPSATLGCVLMSVTEAICLWLYVVILVGLHPNHTPVSFLLSIVIASVLLVGGGLTVVYHLVADASQPGIKSAVEGILLAASCVALLKCTVEIAQRVYFFVNRRAMEHNVRLWMADTELKNKIAGEREDRLAMINAVIRTSAEDDRRATAEGSDATAAALEAAREAAELRQRKRAWRLLADCDERRDTAVVSSVAPVAEMAAPAPEEEALFVQRTGMRKEELWKLL